MYFTTENGDKTKLLPVIAVPITNDVSNEDLAVTEVIKVTFPDSIGGKLRQRATRPKFLLVRRDG
jgi:hypothetical protein